MASASGYNHHRFARTVLKKSRKWEASLIVQLHHSNWRFAESTINFTYDGPMRPFLLALRAQVIPAYLIPFLYDIQPPVSFVDGCLVVEIQDFRRVPESRSRVVMRPAAESLAQTIDIMLERKGEVWDEQLALELESRIIAATSPPLYLGTSILATRNAVLAISLTSPATPSLSADGTFRNPSTSTDEPMSSSARMQKLLRAGERTIPFNPSWTILRHTENFKLLERQKAIDAANGTQGQGSGSAQGLFHGGIGDMGAGGSNGVANGNNAQQDGDGEAPVKKKKKKRPNEDEGKQDAGPAKKKKTASAAAAAAAEAKEEGEKPKVKKKKKKQEDS